MIRIIEVIAPCEQTDTIRGIANHHEVLEHWTLATDDPQRCATRILVRPEKQQAVLDAVQGALNKVENARVLLISVEGLWPRPEPESEKEEQAASQTRSREELYQQISSESQLNSNFLILVFLSTIVAAIGLLENSVAVVVGAMVIAPLLGPNIALAFATALGDTDLVWQSLKTNITGIALALLVSLIIGLLWPYPLNNSELLSRTGVGLDGVVLALASGAAAVLSLTSGSINSLVGVMVAVALLPPTATLGLMLGAGNYQYASGAAMLLAVNIVSINLSAKLAFVFKGVKPRTWLEKRKARQSIVAYVIFWIAALAVLVFLMPLPLALLRS